MVAHISQVPQMWVTVFQFLQLHNLITQLQFLVQIGLHCCQWSRLLMRWNSYRHFSSLTSCEPGIPATDKDAYRPWSWSLDNTDLVSRIEIEDPESHFASTLRRKYLFVSLIRTTGSPPWVMSVATAVVAFETFFEVFLFGKSLCKSLFCRLPLWVHYMSFDMWPDLKQLKHSLIFWTCSRRSFTFIDLNSSHLKKRFCLSLKGRSRFLGLLDTSAFEAKVLVL